MVSRVHFRLLHDFAAKVVDDRKNKKEFSLPEVRAGAIALYMRSGYDVTEVDDCLEYMRLAKKQLSG